MQWTRCLGIVALAFLARPTQDEPKMPFSPRLAVDYMEQDAMAWTKERPCAGCHTNGSYTVVGTDYRLL